MSDLIDRKSDDSNFAWLSSSSGYATAAQWLDELNRLMIIEHFDVKIEVVKYGPDIQSGNAETRPNAARDDAEGTRSDAGHPSGRDLEV